MNNFSKFKMTKRADFVSKSIFRAKIGLLVYLNFKLLIHITSLGFFRLLTSKLI